MRDLINLIQTDEISSRGAKEIFDHIWNFGGNPTELVDKLGLRQVQDTSIIEKIVNDVEQLVKEDSRETNQELRDTTKDIQDDMARLTDKLESAMTELEEKVEKRIKLALENPLSQM